MKKIIAALGVLAVAGCGSSTSPIEAAVEECEPKNINTMLEDLADELGTEPDPDALADADADRQALDDLSDQMIETYYEHVSVGDSGRTLIVQTVGDESDGASFTTLGCLVNELGITDAVVSRIDGTRALDGTREGSWPGYTASWTYHPNNGLRIVIETDQS